MKKLLVNADDFGLTEGITDGIIAAHQHGIVTSTSIMAGGRAFDHAVRQAQRNQRLGVGVHLTLVEEKPVAEPRHIPTLLQPNGHLPQTYNQLLAGIVLGRIRAEHIEQELRAQIAKCFKTGLVPTHLDSHQHVHTLPAIFKIAIRLGEEFGVRAMRLPRDAPRGATRLSVSAIQKTILCLMARWDAGQLRALPFSVCDRMAGLFESGELNERQLLRIIDRLPDGVTELICHPGKMDSESTRLYGHWRYNWELEFNALTSQKVQQKLISREVELITYTDLQSSTKNLPSPISSAGPVR